MRPQTLVCPGAARLRFNVTEAAKDLHGDRVADRADADVWVPGAAWFAIRKVVDSCVECGAGLGERHVVNRVGAALWA